MGVWAYRRVAPIASTSLLFLDTHEPPLRPYVDSCPLAPIRPHAHTPIRVPCIDLGGCQKLNAGRMPAGKAPLAPGLRQLELVVHRSPDFIWVSDVAGNPVFANEAALQLVGVTWDEMLQTPFANLSVPEEREFVKTVVLPAVLKDTRWEGELTFQNLKTGERIPVLGNVFRVDEPETSLEDITHYNNFYEFSTDKEGVAPVEYELPALVGTRNDGQLELHGRFPCARVE